MLHEDGELTLEPGDAGERKHACWLRFSIRDKGAWILTSAGRSLRLVGAPAGDFQSPLC